MSFEQDVYRRSHEKLAASMFHPIPGVNFNPAVLAVPALGALGGLGWGLYDNDDTSTLVGKALNGAAVGIGLTGLHGLLGDIGYHVRRNNLIDKARAKMNEVFNRGWSASPFEKDQMRRWDRYFRRLNDWGIFGDARRSQEARDASTKIMWTTGLPLAIAGNVLRKDYDLDGNYIPVEER